MENSGSSFQSTGDDRDDQRDGRPVGSGKSFDVMMTFGY